MKLNNMNNKLQAYISNLNTKQIAIIMFVSGFGIAIIILLILNLGKGYQETKIVTKEDIVPINVDEVKNFNGYLSEIKSRDTLIVNLNNTDKPITVKTDPDTVYIRETKKSPEELNQEIQKYREEIEKGNSSISPPQPVIEEEVKREELITGDLMNVESLELITNKTEVKASIIRINN